MRPGGFKSRAFHFVYYIDTLYSRSTFHQQSLDLLCLVKKERKKAEQMKVQRMN